MKLIVFLKGLVEVVGLFLSLLDTPGGQMMALGGLMGVGGVLMHSGVMEGGSILTGAFGALLGYITRGRSHKDETSTPENKA